MFSETGYCFQPFGYAGGLYDRRTGLERFGVRDYDPGTGRWIEPDSILFAGGGTNLYAYADNDPVNYIDVTGLWTFQMGLSGSFSKWDFSGTGFVGFAVDGYGNITVIYGGGAGLGVGVGVSGGVFAGVSNAKTVCRLRGPFYNLSGGLGAASDAAGDVFYGKSSGQNVAGGTLTLGAGLGETSFAGRTYTRVGPIGYLW